MAPGHAAAVIPGPWPAGAGDPARWGWPHPHCDARRRPLLPLGGTALSLLAVNPIKLLIVVAVINGMAAAPFLVVVMLIAGSRRLIGDYVNGNLAKAVGGPRRRSWLLRQSP
jgi:hypothetical protein